ncbi:MAG: choline dehydrogenase [Colwellia sp.]
MFIHPLSENTIMFHYVIVGAGSAGCVLANRLSENPDNQVCLLEAGGSDKHPAVYIPLGIAALMQMKRFNWMFNTARQATQNNREIYCPRGKTLGGSSSINAMLYIRGQAQDYDHWQDLGNQGWAFKDVLPYFKRSQHQERGADEFHGVGGPLNVCDLEVKNPLTTSFVKAGLQVGHKYTADFNGKTQEGIGYYQGTRRKGQRCSAAAAYLHPVINRSNLKVITNAMVQRIVMKNGVAVAVEYYQGNTLHRVDATREVILSAGSFQSPQLLMLSGIGAEQELKKHNIDPVHILPGVGQNLQEHIDVLVVSKEKTNQSISLRPKGLLKGIGELLRYLFTRQGMFASTLVESGGFIKSSDKVNTPDLQLQFSPIAMDDHGRRVSLMFNYGFSIHVCLLRPQSRGSISLRSKDPNDAPLIDLNMLATENDLACMVAGVRKVREIINAPEFQDIVTDEILPGSDVTSDEQIEEYLREKANHVYHPVGTCKMGNDDMAVVDDELRVHGVKNLRVVDASIMPTLISGNTNAPTIMIAEKAADLILKNASLKTSTVPF